MRTAQLEWTKCEETMGLTSMLEDQLQVTGEYCFVSAFIECKDFQGILFNTVQWAKYVVV